jgi:hypothetical protein
MTVKWEADWYELDQCIVVGDIDLFYLTKDNLYFENGLSSSGKYEYEVKAEILKITHPQLGEIRGIITIGLDYSIYLSDGTVIIVNAEEHPGEIFNSQYAVSEWSFDVQIHIIEKTGLTAIERQRMYNHNEQKKLWQERIRRYKALLGLSKVDWES